MARLGEAGREEQGRGALGLGGWGRRGALGTGEEGVAQFGFCDTSELAFGLGERLRAPTVIEV